MADQTPLLEREDELERIGRALDRARDREGGLLLVEGEAGAGKTSLLEAARRMAADRGMLALFGRGGEHEREFAYGVARQLFEPQLKQPARRAELLSGSAAMAAPVFGPDPAAGAGDPFGIQHGLFWLAADLAEAAPVALLVDDAQWADPASLRCLAYASRRLEGLPLAMILAVRKGEPGAHEEILDEIRRGPGARAIVPPPLSEGAVSQLIQAELGAPPERGFAEACRRASSGNPFLLGELLRAVRSDGLAPSAEDSDRIASIAAGGVARSIVLRVMRLGDAAAEAARAVAILEPNAEPRHVAALAGSSAEEAADACSRLIAAGLLEDGPPLRFVHPLIREAVYADVPGPRRALLHAGAAAILRAAGADLDAVAAQLLRAPPAADSTVVELLRAAATMALERGAPGSAAEHLRRCLREPPPEAERAAVERELGLALLRADDAEGIEALRAARDRLEDPAARCEIGAELAGALGYRWRSEEAAALLEESLREVPDDAPALATLLRAYAMMLGVVGLEALPEGAFPAPGEVPDGSTREGRMLLEGIAFLEALGLGTIGRARELAERTVADREAAAADARAGIAHHRACATLVLCDRGEPVEELVAPMIEAARERGSLNAAAAAHGIRSVCRLLEGDLRAAQPDAETAVRVSERSPVANRATWLAAATRILALRGELEAARALLAADPELEPGSGLPGAMLLLARAGLESAGGDLVAARDDFRAAGERLGLLPRANPELLGWRTGLAEAEAALGDREEAGRLAAEAVSLAREAGGRRGIGVALRTQGVLAGREGIDALREAAGILGRTRARLEHARALVDLGGALRRANFRREARPPLREGLDLAHRCGAAPLEERAREELAATGARPRRAALTGVESLTPSELRVARLAADGMTNREIAQQLFVTAKTVETHLRHAYQKLDVSKRAELGAALEPARAGDGDGPIGRAMRD